MQFQIDMERRKSNNPLHCCIKISEVIMDSYQELQSAIDCLSTEESSGGREKTHFPSQKIIPEVISAEIINFYMAQKA